MISVDELRQIFLCDSSNGILYWKDPGNRTDLLGKRAGRVSVKGYRHVRVRRKLIYEHRVIWAHHYGEWPSMELDHINRDKIDNRIENLRLASRAENMQNAFSAQSNSKTGYRGVTRENSGGLYRARINVGGRILWLSSHKTAEDASKAYLEAKRLHQPFAFSQ